MVARFEESSSRAYVRSRRLQNIKNAEISLCTIVSDGQQVDSRDAKEKCVGNGLYPSGTQRFRRAFNSPTCLIVARVGVMHRLS